MRTLALGGRPLDLPMQAIGGVKGSQVLQFQDIQSALRKVVAGAIASNKTQILEQYEAFLPSLDEPPMLPGLKSAGSFNYRNSYTRADPAGTPVQFTYEAANGRLFYTLDMITDVTKTWTRAADVAWKGAKVVAGSTTNKDGTLGAKAPGFDKRVVSTMKPLDSPGAPGYKGPYQKRINTLTKRSSLEESLKLGNGEMPKSNPNIIGGL